jgi:hypothetical protein
MRRWALVAAVVALAACSSDKPRFTETEPSSGDEVTPALGEQVVLGLCGSADLLATDPEAASATFLDDAHAGLHTIARELEEVDREAAGEVLETKAAVEGGFASGAPTPEQMAALLTATRDGLSVLGIEAPPCPS